MFDRMPLLPLTEKNLHQMEQNSAFVDAKGDHWPVVGVVPDKKLLVVERPVPSGGTNLVLTWRRSIAVRWHEVEIVEFGAETVDPEDRIPVERLCAKDVRIIL